MGNLEEFEHGGMKFIYINFSGATSAKNYEELMEKAKELVSSHPPKSLFTITSVEKLFYDSNIKKLLIGFMKHLEPYVIFGVVVGINGIKKFILHTLLKLSGRKNMKIKDNKEDAIEWICKNFAETSPPEKRGKGSGG